MKKRLLNTLLFFSLFTTLALATHNRAGEITFVQNDQFTFTVQIHTYTQASSRPADRDSLFIDWGDGNREAVLRNSENFLPNDFKYNIYTATHTYSSVGQFTVSMTDPNRNGGILNVNYPSSDNVPFHIEAQLTVSNSSVSETNQSPVFLQLPIDQAFIGIPFIHNPNAFDPDGDSLAYELIVPLQDNIVPVPNYLYPNEISPGPSNQISLNSATGEFRWESPQREGEYNIAIRVKEYRNGNLIGSTIRDMQILTRLFMGPPPTIDCSFPPPVIAKGEIIEFEVKGTAPSDAGVKLSATGGPFMVVDQPATFDAPADFVNSLVVGTFRWETNTTHVGNQPWQVVFKTESNDGMFTMETVRFTIANSTGLFTPTPLARIQVYPNPASQEIQVAWSIKEQQSETLIARLHSTDGQLLLSTPLNQANGNERIALPELPGGIYHFTLNQAGQVLATQTIVIQ